MRPSTVYRRHLELLERHCEPPSFTPLPRQRRPTPQKLEPARSYASMAESLGSVYEHLFGVTVTGSPWSGSLIYPIRRAVPARDEQA